MSLVMDLLEVYERHGYLGMPAPANTAAMLEAFRGVAEALQPAPPESA